MINEQIVKSWSVKDSKINTLCDIIKWVKYKNEHTKVEINQVEVKVESNWFYDKIQGSIHNRNNSFFSILGIVNDTKSIQQPIIVQDEIGYLGFICKEIDGVLHFLIQAKIEPGNINCIQLSPTIQATRSNFMQLHGGKKPNYLEYFVNATKYKIIVDQIQSEQSSRFYRKRNRNIVIKIDDDIEVLDNYKFVTLGQIKELLKIDNLVNMDTRTVLSCLPITADEKIEKYFTNRALYNSIKAQADIVSVYHKLNNYKMYHDSNYKLVKLSELDNWDVSKAGVFCKTEFPFEVIFCDIEIEGREVTKWMQPLFKAKDIALFGLAKYIENDMEYYVVQIKNEIGCFDKVELAPTLHMDGVNDNSVSQCLVDCFNNSINKKYDVLLSEEGGRFYHEQNRNMIIELSKAEAMKIVDLNPESFVICTFSTLNKLVQSNNVLNIQLRNLLSLMEI